MSWLSLFRKVEEEPEQRPKPNLDSTFFSMQVKELPSDFAQNVMDLEIKIDDPDTPLSLDDVQKLSELYRRAIEYYSQVEPRKAKHFQQKLTSLFSKQQTLSILQSEHKERTVQQHSRNKIRQEMAKFHVQSPTIVAQLIEGSNHNLEKNNQLVRQKYKDQEQDLQLRLSRRSSSRKPIGTTRKAFLSP